MVPHVQGMSCVPNKLYLPGPKALLATQLNPPYAQIDPYVTTHQSELIQPQNKLRTMWTVLVFEMYLAIEARMDSL